MAPKKITKEEARNLIVKCRARMEAMATLITENPTTRRGQHPRLGLLTAAQWFKFIRIHAKHHLKQIQRLKNIFKIG